MNRTDRLTGITLELRSGQRTAAGLALRFEVFRRTILRDMDQWLIDTHIERRLADALRSRIAAGGHRRRSSHPC